MATGAAPWTGRSIAAIVTVVVSARANGNWYSLHNAAVIVTNRIHPVVDRKIPADQVGPHCGILLGKGLRRIVGVRLVLSVIHSNNTSVSRGRAVGSIMWIRPVTAVAETCKTESVACRPTSCVLSGKEVGRP
jgi:hypothetical protein